MKEVRICIFKVVVAMMIVAFWLNLLMKADVNSETVDATEQMEEVEIAESVTLEKDETKIFSRFPGAKSLKLVMSQINPLEGDTYGQQKADVNSEIVDATEQIEEIEIAESVTSKEDETKIFSRFPGAKSLKSVMSQIKPLEGDTYRQRQNNFEGIEDIFVQEEVVISPLSSCFPEKTVRINIYEDKSIINFLNEEGEEEEGQLFNSYNLYRKDEEIILEGIECYTRKYYEYHFQENWYVYGGENVDVPDGEKDFIFLTFKNGTYTLKGTKLTFWNFLSEEATGEIPEPAEPQNVKLCRNEEGYTVYSDAYSGIPYIDKNNNLVKLLITSESENKEDPYSDVYITGIGYEIIASNVKKIVEVVNEELPYSIVYQNEDGDYKLAIISGNVQEVINLNEKTVSKIHFRSYGFATDGMSYIKRLDLIFDVDGYGPLYYSFYDFGKYIENNEDTECLEALMEEEFTVSEFEEKYQKVMQEIKNINNKAL